MSSHAITSIQELRDSGIPSNQAEAIYSVVQSNLKCQDLATKTDLHLSISEVRHEIKDLRTEMHQELRSLESRLTLKFNGTLAASITILIPTLIFMIEHLLKK
jgi:hypothetical protein